MLEKNFVNYLEDGIQNNWEHEALSDYQGETFKYSEIAGHVKYFHQLFAKIGINSDDKIALVGKNSARWAILYISVVSYGATLVPILPDFKSDDLHEIVNHSDSVLLFVGSMVNSRIDASKMPNLIGVLAIDDFSILNTSSDQLRKAHDTEILKSVIESTIKGGKNFSLPTVSNDKLAIISYTSGTTGFTKGVMLPHNSLAANVRFAQNNMDLKTRDKIVSFLPLAHAFGAAFEFLFPFSMGCHVTILTKTPSP
jgi:long-chain acyl-CoA synthetase